MITFINHACFIVESGGVKLLCDPWIAGSAFHDGWNLITEEEHPGIHDVDYIWYSHEHPDHFSIPFLKSVPQEKRGNITVLYQRTNDRRVLDFCRKQGFKTMELEQAERVSLDGGMHVTCGTVPFYDSWMLIETQDVTILNVNDCILETPERLQTIKRHVSRCDILFTQFSYANWEDRRDNPQARRDLAAEKLRRITLQCEAFRPRFVVPFASFVYFSHAENSYMNADINLPGTAVKHIAEHTDAVPVLLKPNEHWHGHVPKNNAAAIAWWHAKYADALAREPRSAGTGIDLIAMHEKADRMIARVKARNNYALVKSMQRLRLIERVCFHLIDRDAYVSFDWIEGLRTLPGPVQPAINLHSESLAFIFDNDFGVDTVNVNARFEGTKADKQRMIRLFSVLALNNTGRFLKFADAGKYLNGQFLRQGLRTVGIAK